jgi:hypothetical protein
LGVLALRVGQHPLFLWKEVIVLRKLASYFGTEVTHPRLVILVSLVAFTAIGLVMGMTIFGRP